jgi:hypothetical protein
LYVNFECWQLSVVCFCWQLSVVCSLLYVVSNLLPVVCYCVNHENGLKPARCSKTESLKTLWSSYIFGLCASMIHYFSVSIVNKIKLGYIELLVTCHMSFLYQGFIITWVVYVLNRDLNQKKYFCCNREFIITEFIKTKFRCICAILKSLLCLQMFFFQIWASRNSTHRTNDQGRRPLQRRFCRQIVFVSFQTFSVKWISNN